MEVPARLIDATVYAPAVLREDSLGGLHDLFGRCRRERPELRDHLGAASRVGRWNRPPERLQNPGQRLVKVCRVNGVDAAESGWQWGVIEQARKDGFSQGDGAVPFEFDEVGSSRALGPYQHNAVVSRNGCSDGFRPLLAAVKTLLITPHGDAVAPQGVLDRSYGTQISAGVAEKHPWHLHPSP